MRLFAAGARAETSGAVHARVFFFFFREYRHASSTTMSRRTSTRRCCVARVVGLASTSALRDVSSCARVVVLRCVARRCRADVEIFVCGRCRLGRNASGRPGRSGVRCCCSAGHACTHTAFICRFYSVIRFESVIHEFDPWCGEPFVSSFLVCHATHISRALDAGSTTAPLNIWCAKVCMIS